MEECSRVQIREMNLKTKVDSFEELRIKGEKQMLGRQLHLKMQEDTFEERRRKGEEQMSEKRHNLESEWSSLTDFRFLMRKEMIAGENSLILDRKQKEHQFKEMTQTLIKEREILKKKKTILMEQQKEIQQREVYLQNKEDEMLTIVTELVQDVLEMKADSIGQQTCTGEVNGNKKLKRKRKSI